MDEQEPEVTSEGGIGQSASTAGLGLCPAPAWWHYRINGNWDGFSKKCPPDDAYDEGTLIPLYATEPVSAEAVAAGMKFCCGKEERLTLEIAALRNVVQAAMIANCKEAFDAWNYHFADKKMEPYKTPNVEVRGAEPASSAERPA